MVKLIIAGATGTCGSEVLRQCLLLPQVEAILALSRRPLPDELGNKKLKTIVMKDFIDYSLVIKYAVGFDACIWCIGGKAKDFKSNEEYMTVSHTYTLSAAKAFTALATQTHKFRFIYLSTWGADITERKWRPLDKRSMYVKGRVEADLLGVVRSHTPLHSFELYTFRPGKAPMHSASNTATATATASNPVSRASTPSPPLSSTPALAYKPIKTSIVEKLLHFVEPTCPNDVLAAALIGVAMEGYGDEGVNVFFENREILDVGAEWGVRLQEGLGQTGR